MKLLSTIHIMQDNTATTECAKIETRQQQTSDTAQSMPFPTESLQVDAIPVLPSPGQLWANMTSSTELEALPKED